MSSHIPHPDHGLSAGFRFDDLAGRTLLVTGVTTGIGRALLPGLLAQGLRLLLVNRGAEALAEVQAHVDPGHLQTDVFECDLAQTEQVSQLTAQLTGKPIDFILHNAAIDPRCPFEKADPAFWQSVFQVNLFAAVQITRAVLPALRLSPQGRIVFTSSITNELGAANLSAYASSKAAIEGLTRSLAHELCGTPITVNALIPGAIRVEKERHDAAVDQRLIAWQSVARRLEPGDLLGPLCLLLSNAGSGISGACIPVDGGLMHPLASPSIQQAIPGTL